MTPLSSQYTSKKTMIAIGFGLMGSILFGRVFFIEAFALVWLLFLGGHKKLSALFSLKYSFIGLFYLSALGLLIADLLNDTPPDSLIKGVGAYLIFPTTVAFISTCLDISQLWVAINTLVLVNLFRSDAFNEIGFTQDNFKFGYSFALVFALLSLTVLISRLFKGTSITTKYLSIFSTLAIALLGLWGNLRLLSLCAAIAYILSELFSSRLYKVKSRNVDLKSLLLVALSAPLILIAVSIIFGLLSLVGFQIFLPFVNDNALEKTQIQSTGLLGIIFGGRSEIFSSILAWLDKPLYGWGSWAVDSDNYYRIQGARLQAAFGYEVDASNLYEILSRRGVEKYIPTHSVILALLVWSGFFGVIPVYLYFSQSLIDLIAMSRRIDSYSYPYLFSFVLGIWNFLFSPFGYSNRVFMAYLFSIPICIFRKVLTNRNPTLENSDTPSHSLNI